MVDIKGLQKLDMLNYEPYAAATIFLSRCNFHCPFCHNPDLVAGHDKLPSIRSSDVLSHLSQKKKWYDAVCITGGEPTLHPGLPAFMSELKALGMKIKLDTNGTNPGMLSKILSNGLVDYVAMDMKHSIDKYDSITQVRTDTAAIQESVRLVRSAPDYEFRTTVIPHFHKAEDLLAIAESLKGSNRYVLQRFRSDMPMLLPSFKGKESYHERELLAFSEMLKPYFSEVLVKNS